MSGKHENFTDDQVAALREALREYFRLPRSQGKMTQAELGDVIGVSQQIAGRLLGDGHAGLSYGVASRIAKLQGFDGVDAFFRDRKLTEDHTLDKVGHRGFAIRIARQLGATEPAIGRVLARCKGPLYEKRPARWWLEQFLSESDQEGEPPRASGRRTAG